MPISLPYDEVLTRWDRSRAFGDPRDLSTFSRDMTQRTTQGLGDADYSAGLRDGPWTRFSTRLDQVLHSTSPYGDTVNTVGGGAGSVLGELGAGVGDIFGHEEAGRRVGQDLPRALLNTAPLYLAGPETGVPATIAALGETGLLMGAHTYAQTGNVGAAAISGATGALLPAIGKVGGDIGASLFGGGERVAGELAGTPYSNILPSTANDITRFNRAAFLGKQTAEMAANQASMYLTSKQTKTPYDPTSPDFWLQQIPFTAFDVVHAMSREVSTAEDVRPQLTQPQTPKPPSTYTPPVATEVQQANIDAALQKVQQAYADPATPPEMREAALTALVTGVQSPETIQQIKEAGTPPPNSMDVPIKIVGRSDRIGTTNNYRVLVDSAEADTAHNVNPGSTVFVNNANPTFDPETGRMVFEGPIRNVKPARFGLMPQDFGQEGQQQAPVEGQQPELPVQEGVTREQIESQAQGIQSQLDVLKQRLTSADQGSLVDLGQSPEVVQAATQHPELAAPLKESAASAELARAREIAARVAVKSPLDDATKIPSLVGEEPKPVLDAAISHGASAPQAVETARLVAQTPAIDAALQDQNLAAAKVEDALAPVKSEWNGQEQNQYQGSLKDENGKRIRLDSLSQAQEFLDNHKREHPEDNRVLTIRDAGYSKRKGSETKRHLGFYVAEIINKGVSLDQPLTEGGQTLQNIIPSEGSLAESMASQMSQMIEERHEGALESLQSVEPLNMSDMMHDDFGETLDAAAQNPGEFAELSGFTDEDGRADLPSAFNALKQSRVMLPLFQDGVPELGKLNKALTDAGLEKVGSSGEAQKTLQKVLSGAVNFKRSFSEWNLGGTLPYDPKLVAQSHVFDGPVPFTQWLSQQTAYLGVTAKLIAGWLKLPSELNQVKFVFPGDEAYVPNMGDIWYPQNGQSFIQFGRLPTEETLGEFIRAGAHELTHHMERMVDQRTDPAALEYKQTRTDVLNVLRESKALPTKVRQYVQTALKEGHLEDFYMGKGPETLAKWNKALGPDVVHEWGQVMYGLLDEYEMMAQTFSMPKFVSVMRETQLAKPSFGLKSVLDIFSRAWNKMFGGQPETDNAFAQILSAHDKYLMGGVMQNSYSGLDLARQHLIRSGVVPEALPSRLSTTENMFNRGDLFSSLTGYTREGDTNTLPQSSVYPEVINRKMPSAALQYTDGQVVTGDTHALAVLKADKLGLGESRVADSGFVTNKGRFVSNHLGPNGEQSEAARIAGVTTTGLDSLQLSGLRSPINPDLSKAIVTGSVADVGRATMNLLLDDVPLHQELLQRMKQDLVVTKALHDAVREGQIPGDLNPDAVSKLRESFSKVNAMERAMDKQAKAISRWNDLNNFTVQGMEQTQASQLVKASMPTPPDPTQVEDEAQAALGLRESPRTAASREQLEGKGPGFITRTFMLTQFLKQQVPAIRPIVDRAQQAQGDANVRKNELNYVYGHNSATGELDKKVVDNNLRVLRNPALNQAASDIRRWYQVQEKGGLNPTFGDPFVQKVLSRLNPEDRTAVTQEFNSANARHEHWTDQIVPKFLHDQNVLTTSHVIAATSPGMLPDVARDLSGQMYDALALVSKPETMTTGMENLRMLSTKMDPEVYLKALQLSQGMVQDAQSHIDFMKSRPNYVTEQRFDKHHIVMAQPDGSPYRAGWQTQEAALRDVQQKEKQGYKFVEYVPKENANAPSSGVDSDVMGKFQELDKQAANRITAVLGDNPQLLAQVLPLTQRASDYEASMAAFQPVPGAGTAGRKFVGGRENINMIENDNRFYANANNFLRIKTLQANTRLDLLHPDLLADRVASNLAQQHVNNQMSNDNPFVRKATEATYFTKLAWNFGVNFLHGIQSLTTGMASAIAETGSVGDAFEYTGRAAKAVGGRIASGVAERLSGTGTGKWADPATTYAMNRLTAEGNAGIASWDDIRDPDRDAMYAASSSPNPVFKGINTLQNAARRWTDIFARNNDMIGALSGFYLGVDRGMSYEDAYKFGLDLKNRGYYSGGKNQRAVGLWSIKTKAVPQLLSSLQTYTFGWFSQLLNNFHNGFGEPPKNLTPTQRVGAKKAFLYQLGAQAVLAGALGLPGMGQGMALMKQVTGTDPNLWLKGHLNSLFDEDQDHGGLLSTLALHGATAAFTPIDTSGRHMPSFPFIGVSPYKGFDISNLASAPVSTASDMVKGLIAAAHGDAEGAKTLLPHVLQGPFELWHGEGDIRGKGGNLLYKMSPSEQFITALGMTPSKVQDARDVDAAVKQADANAAASKAQFIAHLATTYRQAGATQAQQEMLDYLQQHPDEDGRALARSVATSVQAQTLPMNPYRAANPAADLTGLTAPQGGQEVARAQLGQNVQQSLGLRSSITSQQHQLQTAALMDSNPYLTGQQARGAATLGRVPRPYSGTLTPMFPTPYQGVGQTP